MNTTLVHWAITVMNSVQPPSATPWANTYEGSAETIVKVAEEQPLFKGEEGVRRTVAQLLSLGWFESRFDPKAKGDGKCLATTVDGRCTKRGQPQSLCMFQIGRSNFASLKTTEAEILGNFEVCVRSAMTMIRISYGICAGRPSSDLLGHYASGGNTCGGLIESRHRVNKAVWIMSRFPFNKENSDG